MSDVVRGRRESDRSVLGLLSGGWATAILGPLIGLDAVFSQKEVSVGVALIVLAAAWVLGAVLHPVALKRSTAMWSNLDIADMTSRNRIQAQRARWNWMAAGAAVALLSSRFLEDTIWIVVFMGLLGGFSLFLIRGAYVLHRLDVEQAGSAIHDSGQL
ncbi:MAG: hypothetical protein ACRDKT_15965 [Actinomycetota bacterium]